MRKITKDAYNAFMNNKSFKLNNTQVIVKQDNTVYITLFGNSIARKNNTGIFISDGGYGYSRTTQERLSAFPIKLRVIKGEWIINEKEKWDGNWININKFN